jgi:hypothetical protein
MQIVEDTPDRLTMEDRPWVLGAGLAIAILLMVVIALQTVAENIWLGLGMTLVAALFGVAFVAFVRRVIVIFDRKAAAVVIRTKSLLGQTEATYALADVRGAGIDTSVNRSTSQGTGSTTHRTVLQMPAGDVPLTEVYSGGDNAARMAEAVNRWLGTPGA